MRLALVVAMLVSVIAVAFGNRGDPIPVRVGYIPVAIGARIFVIDGEGWDRERRRSASATASALPPATASDPI